MPNMDVFNNDAFSAITLTASVNKEEFVPGAIGGLGIFEEQGITTTTIMIEEEAGTLQLIPTSPRGAPPVQRTNDKRKMRSFVVPHIAEERKVWADEIQGVRAFGSEDDLQAVQTIVDQRQRAGLRNLDATLEHHRLGAIKGEVVDADGSTVLFNLFDEFGVTQEAEVNFALGTADTDVRAKCMQVRRTMSKNLKLGDNSSFRIIGLASDEFFDALINHDNVKEAFTGWEAARTLAQDHTFGRFTFAGIEFWNYRGTDDGSIGIANNKANFFPAIPGLFITRFAPADTIDFANTVGLPRYSLPFRDPRDKFWATELQSNPINLCLRPKALMQGRRA